MAFLNDHYLKLKAGYLFPEIARRVNAYAAENTSTAKSIIRCGIGDVTEPLPAAVREAMHQAVDEMGRRETFRGYGPEQGYEFLRHAIAENDYRARGLQVADDEIFVSDGSKCDCGNILDIFGHQNRIAVMDPVYPVYVDTNVMAGHTGEADSTGSYSGLVYLACNAGNHFVPGIPDERVDLVYLCYPNNPTGAVATQDQLGAWVNYALASDAIILFDAAYEAYIQDSNIPHSIYEIPRADECASTSNGEKRPLFPLWHRRFSTKFNSVSYPVQRGAEAIYTSDGKKQVRELIEHYLNNAEILSTALAKTGLKVFGGRNAPYIWIQAPTSYQSWDVFDKILNEIQVVITPGAGFGSQGEGYFRVSAFNSGQNAEEVARRFQALKW